jgi:peptide-methionine (S)-S-oxide reductase
MAYFAGGCFWCTEAVFERVPGVSSVVSGYMQGAETIQISFDPTRTSYEKLLSIFWRAHNPTEVDSQGPDVGKQYRSAIFYVDEQQRAAAEKSKTQAQKSYSKPIATAITRAGSFRSAPENHQNFCRKNPNNPYVRQIILPKLQKLGLNKP